MGEFSTYSQRGDRYGRFEKLQTKQYILSFRAERGISLSFPGGQVEEGFLAPLGMTKLVVRLFFGL